MAGIAKSEKMSFREVAGIVLLASALAWLGLWSYQQTKTEQQGIIDYHVQKQERLKAETEELLAQGNVMAQAANEYGFTYSHGTGDSKDLFLWGVRVADTGESYDYARVIDGDIENVKVFIEGEGEVLYSDLLSVSRVESS